MKNFDTWNSLKKEIHEKKTTPLFSEGEIWWTHFGLNVGYELDGKHDHFERPICIYKKHNENHFLAIPVTSSENKAPWITELQHGEKIFRCNLSQIKTMSSKRLIRRMAKLSENNKMLLVRDMSRHYIHTNDERPSFEGLSRAPMAK